MVVAMHGLAGGNSRSRRAAIGWGKRQGVCPMYFEAFDFTPMNKACIEWGQPDGIQVQDPG
jgi:hypothetical protein